MKSTFEQSAYVLKENSFDTERLNSEALAPANTSGEKVDSYAVLKRKLAALKVANPSRRLLFRGQKKEYKLGEKKPNIYPAALRRFVQTGEVEVDILGMDKPIKAYAGALHAMGVALPNVLKQHYPEGNKRYLEQGIEFLALVQHYEILPTMLLDVSGNPQVGYSFAYNGGDPSFLYVLSTPEFSDPISINVDAEILVADLAKACPRTALRPHFQDGFVIAPYPEIHKKWNEITMHEGILKSIFLRQWDFSKIVLAKFILTSEFWSDPDINILSNVALFPNAVDPVFEIANSLRATLGILSQSPN